MDNYGTQWYTIAKNHNHIKDLLAKRKQMTQITNLVNDANAIGERVLRRTRKTKEYVGFLKAK